MEPQIDLTIRELEARRHETKLGGHYWMARDLQEILGYGTWENFQNVLARAKAACAQSGVAVDDRFRDVTKTIISGKGARTERADAYLDRYACYLVAMNGDPAKPQVAAAQTYFAVQTRRQELTDADAQLDYRHESRQRLTKANRELHSAAKNVGVQNYALFNDAGYKGLYQMGLADIKRRKKLEEKDELFDRCGRAELAANEFRATQAEAKLKRGNIQGEKDAVRTHREVGEEVRKTMLRISGTPPEDLPPEPSLKKLISERAKKQKKLAKVSSSERKLLS